MLKRIIAFIAAFVIPYLILMVVIQLNESDFNREELIDKQVNFDIKKQKEIKTPELARRPKPKRRTAQHSLASVKPSGVVSSIEGSGLSFGIPQFDEAEFDTIKDDELLTADNNQPMDKETVDTPPKVKRRSPIVYPELARRQGISGYVTMNVLIGETGNVEDVEIIDSKPKEIFDLKADSTIRTWKFEPATYNGKKVKVWAMQKIVFKLN